MATIPLAQIIPGPQYTLSVKGVSDAQGLFMLGNADPENSAVGSYAIDFRMSLDWVGSIAIIARNSVLKAGQDDIPLLGPWPFRAFYFNGAGWDGSILTDRTGPSPVITSTSSILVPASGVTIGLAVTCSAGTCAMYYLPLLGQSAV